MTKRSFLNRSKILFSSVIFLLFFILTTAVVLFEFQKTFVLDGIQVGEPAPRDIFAPAPFSLPNIQKTEKLKLKLREKVVPVYSFDSKLIEKADNYLKSLTDSLEVSAKNSEITLEDIDKQYELSKVGLKAFFETKKWKSLAGKSREIILETFRAGILDNKVKSELARRGKNSILVEKEKGEEDLVALNNVLSKKEALLALKKTFSSLFKSDKKVQSLWFEISERVVESNLEFNEVATERYRKRIEDELPPIMDFVKKNQILAKRGEIIQEADYERIEKALNQLTKQKVFSTAVAKVVLIFTLFILFVAFLFLFEKNIFLSFNQLLLIQTVIFLTLLLERIVFILPEGLVYFLLPVSLTALLLSLLVNYRIAVIGIVVTSVLTAILSGFQPDLILFALAGGFAGVIATVGLKKRSQFIKAGAIVGVVNLLVIFSYWFFNNVSFYGSLQLGLLGLANGFLMAALIFFVIIFFERVFKVTTDITLLELSDLNHPLLKQMVVEAPGTYHHTLMIANMCEGAAGMIGASPLLARVGGYFHDIGKISQSEYYSENESVQNIETKVNLKSIHKDMDPEKSRDVILVHVKRGIELGKKYKLPQVILNFIPEHHGTGMIYYFYRKAKEQRKPDQPPINENDYRYPGPKPQTKEAAIALLADSVEAVSRTLLDHSKQSLTENVRKIINEKFIDGQLDECPLTLKDLEMISESFVRTLTGVYHTRIQYPEKDEKDKRPKLFSN